MPVFVYMTLTAAQQDRLRRLADGEAVHLHGPGAGGGVPAALRACDVVFGNVPARWIEASPAIRWVQLESVGVAEYTSMMEGPVGRRLTMTNLAGFFSEPVAETALCGILTICRGIDRLALLRRDRHWLGDTMRPTLRCLQGARVLIFGRGDIGQRLSELLVPFGCAVTAVGRGWSGEALDAAVAASDVVVGVAPDTPATRGVFDRRRLLLMPRGGVFVNVGRGTLIEEEALADMLEAGRLSGAVIDVTLDEPLPPDHRFWTCPGLILTQHTAGGTGDEIDRKIEHFRQNLERYRRGEPLVGEVNVTRGY